MSAHRRTSEIIDLTLPGARCIRARRLGGSGSPLVFLHGLLDSSEGWREIAAASHRPSVAFDLPGFGGSDLPTRSRVSAYAEDIAAAMTALGLREVTLVGHSLGGAVATGVAELLPDRVASLVLLAPAGFGRIALAEAVALPGMRRVAGAVLPLWLNAPLVLNFAYRLFVTAGHAPAGDALDRVRRDSRSLVPGAVAATQAVVAAGLSPHAFHQRRVGYQGPVSALWGEGDRVVPPAHAAGLLRGLPQARLTCWSGMGHHPQCERSGELSAFLEASAALVQAPDRRPVARRRLAAHVTAGAARPLSAAA
jgi:pimeloyl-ACP methyl ester carboxylesterase